MKNIYGFGDAVVEHVVSRSRETLQLGDTFVMLIYGKTWLCLWFYGFRSRWRRPAWVQIPPPAPKIDILYYILHITCK